MNRQIRALAEDANTIGDWGSTFPKTAGDILFGIK